MAESSDQIAGDIESRRDALRSNLEELEGKVRAVTDWRLQVRRHPGVLLGVAFGAGFILAGLVRPPRRRPQGRSTAAAVAAAEQRAQRSAPAPASSGHVRRLWEDVQGALIGVGASKLTDTLSQFLPGFREHLDATRARRARGNGVQGEGDYQAARRYQADVERYVQGADIEGAARAAAPRSEEEARELAAAEAAGRARKLS